MADDQLARVVAALDQFEASATVRIRPIAAVEHALREGGCCEAVVINLTTYFGECWMDRSGIGASDE